MQTPRHDTNPRALGEGEQLAPGMWLLLDTCRQGNLMNSFVGFVYGYEDAQPPTFEVRTNTFETLYGITRYDVRLVLADPPPHTFAAGDRVVRVTSRGERESDSGVYVVNGRVHYQPAGYTYWLDDPDGGRGAFGVGEQYLRLAGQTKPAAAVA
jgi:hypothetical protein